MRKNLVVMAMLVMTVLSFSGCGDNSGAVVATPSSAVSPAVSPANAAFGVAEVKGDFRVAQKGGNIATLTVADVIAKEKGRVTSVNITYETSDNVYLRSEDFPVVDGQLNAKPHLPIGIYTFSIYCNDTDGYEVFNGTIQGVNISEDQPAIVIVPVELSNIPVYFAVTGLPGTFDKSVSKGDDGVTYDVSTQTVDGNYSKYGEDRQAYMDQTGMFHFAPSLQIHPDLPYKIYMTVTDKTGASIIQALDIDGPTLLKAIYNGEEIHLSAKVNGTAEVMMTFPG